VYICLSVYALIHFQNSQFSLLSPLPWHSDCQAKVDGQKDTCTCLCVCVSVLLRWLGESRAGWALIEARNNIKANLSFPCLCLLRSPWHSVTQWLPHPSHHLDLVSVSFSLFDSLTLSHLSTFLYSFAVFCLFYLLKYHFLNIKFLSLHGRSSMRTKITKKDIENAVCEHTETLAQMHIYTYSHTKPSSTVRILKTTLSARQSLWYIFVLVLEACVCACICLRLWLGISAWLTVSVTAYSFGYIFLWKCLSMNSYFLLLVTKWKKMQSYCQ